MNIQFTVRSLSIAGLCMLSACAPFGKQTPLETPTAYSLPQGRSAQIARVQWWRQLNDARLNQLVNQALATSPNLRMVQARFEQAQAQLGITESAGKTQIGLAVRGIGTYVSHKPSAQEFDTDHTLLLANAALQGSWSLDFWGKNRSQVASALGRRQAVAYEAEQAGIELAAGGFAKADPLALIVRRRGGEMAVTLRGMRHHLRQALPIVGKTAAGQHHGARFDEYLPAVAAQHCTGHSLRTLQQSDRRGVELKTHPGVEGGSQQTGDQRIAIDQMLPPSGA